ncbi:MAG: septum formation initiator family protein, partial [Acidothermales bacterium]|nr:septum formation initiator family protein [Acidothermales bacterium]
RRSTGSTRRTVPVEAPEERPRQQPLSPEVRRRFTSRAAVLLAVICLLAVGLTYPLREYVEQRHQISELEAQQRRNAQDIATLQQQQRRWQDPAYVEQQARQRLQYAKPGEITYVVVGQDDNGAKGHGSSTDRSTAHGPSWSERVWGSVRVADRP